MVSSYNFTFNDIVLIIESRECDAAAKTIGFDVLLLKLFELVFDDEVMEHLYYQPKLYLLIT